jgi:hypothetical protein
MNYLHLTVSPGAKFKSTNRIDGGVENTGTFADSITRLSSSSNYVNVHLFIYIYIPFLKADDGSE